MINLKSGSLNTRRPTDLDEQLLALTGCDSTEIARNIAGIPLASTLAAAMLPFLGKDAPSVPELAELIAESDKGDVQRQIIALYGDKTVSNDEPTSGS